MLRSTTRRVPLGTTSSSSCPPSRRFFAMALLPSPFPTMRPTILLAHERWAGEQEGAFTGGGLLEGPREPALLSAINSSSLPSPTPASRAAHHAPSFPGVRASNLSGATVVGRVAEMCVRGRSALPWSHCSSWRALGRRGGRAADLLSQGGAVVTVGKLESVYRHCTPSEPYQPPCTHPAPPDDVQLLL